MAGSLTGLDDSPVITVLSPSRRGRFSYFLPAPPLGNTMRICEAVYCNNDISHRHPNARFCCDDCFEYRNLCVDCGKKISRYGTRCIRCSNRRENNPFWGKSHKPESIEKMRQSAIKRAGSTQRKIAETRKRKRARVEAIREQIKPYTERQDHE